MILCCLQIQLQWLWRNFCMFNPVLWHRITARCNIISTKYFVALLVHIMSYWENSKTNQDLKLIRRVQREKRDCCNGISSLQRMLKKIWAYSVLASLSSNFDARNFSRLVQFYKCIVKRGKHNRATFVEIFHLQGLEYNSNCVKEKVFERHIILTFSFIITYCSMAC